MKDNNIFTIGDRTNYGTIKRFEKQDNMIRVYFEEQPLKYHVNLNTLKHAKKPLFTTEDKVEIFEGDEWYNVYDQNYHEKRWIWVIYHVTKNNTIKLSLDNKSIHRFSTKKAAEAYIALNKPVDKPTKSFSLSCFTAAECAQINQMISEAIKRLE